MAHGDNKFESVYSDKLRAGKRRTYFFDVRQTKGDDYYITLTESTKRFEGNGYERHKIFLYKEDFNRFVLKLNETVDYVKTELMPDFDYDQFQRRQEEWEAEQAAIIAAGGDPYDHSKKSTPTTTESPKPTSTEEKPSSDDDMSW